MRKGSLILITRPKSIVLAVIVLALGALGGALFGDPAIPEGEQKLIQRASRITVTLMDWLPEETEASDLVYDGISGMLEILDPHSNFLDPKSFRKMRERQEGSFFGVGIIISMRNAKVTVIAPMAGTPAARKGLRAGDIIEGIEGQPTEKLSLEEVVDQVRGPEGSPVTLTIRRPGIADTFDVEIVRARIPTNSVRYSFMINDTTGYIRLGEFSNTSEREMREAIAGLAEKGMKRLIFDLRNNPGGALDAAIGVSDIFLRKKQIIVSTEGRNEKDQSIIRAPGREPHFRGPLVILINEGSASASEIVSGAVQDHDRGLVVGEISWGKGLVQTVFSVRDGGLALTTARYYTPSGRCIQRSYESYIDYMTHKNIPTENNGEGQENVYTTDTGRTVLGGGGITPDVRASNRELTEAVVRLYGSSAFFRYSVRLLKDTQPEDYRSFAESFGPDQELVSAFLQWSLDEEILNEEQLETLKKDKDAMGDVQRGLKVEVLDASLGLEAGYREGIKADEVLVAGIKGLDEAARIWTDWEKRENEADGLTEKSPLN